MERLTERVSENIIELSAKANPIQYNGYPQRVHIKHQFWNVFNKLCNYEDAEEQGLLLRLPCKVGTKVWFIREITSVRRELIETEVEKVVIKKRGLHIKLLCNSFYETSCNSIGKTVFLTKAEAEQALAEMKAE